jgi:NADPH:quinone reductase-like Zn-dependent oxidoreductase
MLAIRVNEFGGPDVLRVEEVDIPKPGQDEILVRVMAAGVGPWDVSLRQGGYPSPLPYIPGGEFAGVVEGDTGSFAGFYDGAPVYGYPGLTGCYAQYVTCPVEQLAPIPAALSVVDAAATPIDALTAEQGLTDELGVGADDRLLITAGAGGLGHFAVQIARALGAIVVATASPQHHEFVHKLGAAVVVDHTKPDWPERVRDVIDGGPAKVPCLRRAHSRRSRPRRQGRRDHRDSRACRLPGRAAGHLAVVQRQAARQPPDQNGPLVRRWHALGSCVEQVLLAGRCPGTAQGQ